MSDWITRGRANAIAQDEALRRKWQGLASQSTSSIQIQTPKISPAKPAGEGSMNLDKKTVPNVNQKFPVRSPTDPTFPEVIAAKKTGQSASVRTRDAAGVRNSFANRDHELTKMQSELNSQQVRTEKGQSLLPANHLVENEQQNSNANPAKNMSSVDTIMAAINMGAGNFNKVAYGTLDVLANAIPTIEGWMLGEDKDATFTGQILRPITNITGKLKDYVDRSTDIATQRVYEATEGKPGARAIAELGADIVSALPTAILAMSTGGASLLGTGGTLAAQTSGISGTVVSAAEKLLKNPMFKVLFAQSLGKDYEKAKNFGASDMEALAAASVSSLLNATMDVSGGIETLPEALREASGVDASKMNKLVGSAFWDAKEGLVQDTISRAVDKTVLGKSIPFFSWKDENAVANPGRMAKDFAKDAAVSASLGGLQIVTDEIVKKLNEIDLSKVTTNNVKEVRYLENASEEQVMAYVQKSYLDQNDCQFMKICEVSPDLAQKLEAVGLYVEDGNHALRDNDLRHVRKSHGDLSNDKYKVTEDDYRLLPDILENYDELYLGYPTENGNTTIVYEKTIDQKVFYVEEVLEDGVLSTKQMLKVGKKRKPSFMKKYTRITDAAPDTDVPPKAEPTGLSPPGNHVPDARAYVGYGDSVLQAIENVKETAVDLFKMDETTREKILALQEAYEKYHRKSDHEELERLLMEGFAQEMDGDYPVRGLRASSGYAEKDTINQGKSLTDSTENGSVLFSRNEDIIIGRSLGAKAKNYDIELPNREIVHLTEGTRVTNLETIAGKGRNRIIDEIDGLLEKYPESSEFEWQKKKGIGYIDYGGESFKVNLHWYEEPSVGKVKWKVKPDKDGNWFYDD